MAIISLPLLPVKGDGKRKPGLMTQAACRELAGRVMKARSLRAAALLVKETAELLPVTPPNWHHAAKRVVPGMGWREYLTRLAERLLEGRPAFKVFSRNGNTKLPFMSFSTLPFFTCPGMGACEQFCYSLRAWRYPGGFTRQLQNTLLMRHRREWVARAFRKVKVPAGETLYFRLYVDGDFRSAADVLFWMNLLDDRPEILAYGYSKSWDELWEFGQRFHWPANYVLNLSSGGRVRGVSLEQMKTLPVVRNEFIALRIDYHPKDPQGRPLKGNVGFRRYDDDEYHAAVRRAAREAGLGAVYSCPGKCGECSPHGHVCGMHRFNNVVVAIGVH